MQVISVVQQKGGVGKTTLAINLAGELRRRNKDVIVIDADPQASALAWARPGKLGFEVRPELLSTGTASQWLRSILKLRADFTVIDTPAGIGGVFRAAVEAADLVLIPCGPSSLDLNSARQTLVQVTSALRNDHRSRARILTIPTRVDIEMPEGQQLADELNALGEAVGPALSHDMYYVRAFTIGVSLAAVPSSKAAHELSCLADSVLDTLAPI